MQLKQMKKLLVSLALLVPYFTFAEPIVTKVTPGFGLLSRSTEIAILGEGFGKSIASITVKVGGKEALVTSVSETEIVATVPTMPEIGAFDVTVIRQGESDVVEGGFHYLTRLPWKYTFSLPRGINMVSLPLQPLEPMRASDLADLLDATWVIHYDREEGRFRPFVPAMPIPSLNVEIEPTQGYIVSVTETQEVDIYGTPWGDPIYQSPARPRMALDQTPDLWAFLVFGRLTRDRDAKESEGEKTTRVAVRNMRSGKTVEAIVTNRSPDEPQFTAVFVNADRSAVVSAGDRFEATAFDGHGNRVSGPRQIRVSSSHLDVAYLHTDLILGDLVPMTTRLLPNYPNPFNPETWIPFELAEPAEVTVSIHGSAGTMVRSIDVGFKDAGNYTSPGQAVHWDGTSATGERVASGIYFYTLRIQQEEKHQYYTRKMVILK